jgi:spore coat protein U-like protein
MKAFAKISLVLATAILTVAASSSASAQTSTSNLSVTANINNNCAISSTPVAFGNYDPIVGNLTSDLTATGTVLVTCTIGDNTVITLGEGLNKLGGSTPAVPLRQAANSGNKLNYFLYQESSHTTGWGNTGAAGISITGSGIQQSIPVYGVIGHGQNMPAGSYTDTVVVTVSF